MSNIYDKASLVLIPSGTKTSKVYSQKPVNGDGDFTFSRSTAATRVNASGNIEKETQNLLLQSNSFNTTWSTSNASVTGGQGGYDGSSDAWELNGTGSGGRIEQNLSVSGVKVFSVYAKAGTTDGVVLRVIDGGSNPYIFWSLVDGSYQGSTGGGGINPSTQAVENVGGGWYRFQITTSTAANQVIIYAGNSTGGFATGTIYIQDAQLEQGLVARDYIETTTAAVYGGITDNTPRLDYTDSSCPALLLEPLRTNIFTESEYFDGNAWTKYGGASLTNNNAVSPEGVQNATKLTDVGGIYDQIPYTPDTNYVFSLFAKTDTATSITLNFVDQAAGYLGGTIQYTFSTNVASVIAQSANGSVTADKEDYGNGWIRVFLKFKTNVAQNYNYQSIEFDGGNGWIFGAQLEAGNYPTSYIPTYGSSVSRVADYSVRSDMQDYVSADEGTWFMHFKDLFFDITGTGQGSINLVYNSGNQIEFLQRGNLQYKIAINNSTAVDYLDGEDKVAVAWSTSGLVIYINGVSRYTSTSSAYANPYSTFELTRNDRRPRVDMKQILFFKTRLSNEELAALTTI